MSTLLLTHSLIIIMQLHNNHNYDRKHYRAQSWNKWYNGYPDDNDYENMLKQRAAAENFQCNWDHQCENNMTIKMLKMKAQ